MRRWLSEGLDDVAAPAGRIQFENRFMRQATKSINIKNMLKN